MPGYHKNKKGSSTRKSKPKMKLKKVVVRRKRR